MSFRVKTVAELTGIPRNTLLAWERRYGVPGPERTAGGYRVYSDAEVAFLRELKRLVDQGLSISEAIARVRRPASEPAAESTVPSGRIDELLEPLLRFDRVRAEAPLRWVEQLPLDVAVHEVWLPLLRRVGDGWARKEISVGQEHFVSAVAREAAMAWFRALGPAGSGPRAVCACAPDELHDLPLLWVAVELRRLAWRVSWLGAQVPEGDLAHFAASMKPDVVCLSGSHPGSGAALLAEARAVLAGAPASTLVVLGGAGAAELPPEPEPRVWHCRSAAELAERWAAR